MKISREDSVPKNLAAELAKAERTIEDAADEGFHECTVWPAAGVIADIVVALMSRGFDVEVRRDAPDDQVPELLVSWTE